MKGPNSKGSLADISGSTIRSKHNDLSRPPSMAALVMLLLLIQGCGYSPNPSASSVGTQPPNTGGAGTQPPNSGGTGTPVGIGGQAAPAPGTFRPLTGCTNPNQGVSNNDWGVDTSPVYTTPVDVTVGAPIYSSNTIFWISPETGPGQSVLLTGAFTNATKYARIALIPPGTIDWAGLVQKSSVVVSTTQQSTTGLSFIIPSTFPSGVYGFEIEDPSAPSISALANSPSVDWVVGTPAVTLPNTALQHQVYDCGAEPGGILRLSGKNFLPSDQVILQSSNGVAYALSPTKLDANSIAVPVPNSLEPGTYNVWVGGVPWDATSSAAGQVTINVPPALIVRSFACSDLVPDGKTDNTRILQSCLDRYSPVTDSGELAYIEIPSGTFVLTAGVSGHSFEVLMGPPTGSASFLGQPKDSPPSAWFTIPQYFGLANISLRAPANPNLLLSTGTATGNPVTSGHLFFSNVNFESTADASGGQESMFAVAGPDIQVYGSSFRSDSHQAFDILFGDGGIFSGNDVVLDNWTGLGISDSQNIIFEQNLIHSDNQPGEGPNGLAAGSGLAIGRGNNQYGPSALSRDIYVGYNTFKNMGSNGQQVITNDGDGGSYFGPIASSTATTVILANSPAWNWMGTTNPGAAVMAIISGTGVGQYSFLQSYNDRTMNLQTPWKVIPDETSVVVITQYNQNITFAHNVIDNTLGASIVLGDALESLVEDNLLSNSGLGILVAAYGPYGGPAGYGPVMNNGIFRNVIVPGAGNLISPSVNPYLAGIGIQDMPGCLESGLVIRGNVVNSIDSIFSTDGLNGVNANLIELNQAFWTPTFPIPGFLIQDNTPPPS